VHELLSYILSYRGILLVVHHFCITGDYLPASQECDLKLFGARVVVSAGRQWQQITHGSLPCLNLYVNNAEMGTRIVAVIVCESVRRLRS
jgi:hypothetical protein